MALFTINPLVVAALLPAVVLAIYIYKKDRSEKNPASLLLLLLGVGALCVIPAALIERVLALFTDAAFSGAQEGSAAYYAYHLIDNFLCTALVEEGVKWIAVQRVTARSRHFSSMFDGVIYCAFVGLGFAAAENVKYVYAFGFQAALTRAVTAVPGHMFFGVLMGYYYSLWHVQFQAQNMERYYTDRGLINPEVSAFRPNRQLIPMLALPVLVHGLYDFCLSLTSAVSTIAFYVLLIVLYVTGFRRIKNVSENNSRNGTLAMGLLLQKYPDLTQTIFQESVAHITTRSPEDRTRYAQPYNAAAYGRDRRTAPPANSDPRYRGPYAQPGYPGPYARQQPPYPYARPGYGGQPNARQNRNPYSVRYPNPYGAPRPQADAQTPQQTDGAASEDPQ